MTPNRDVLVRQGSSVESVTDMSAFEEALRERICHWYPKTRATAEAVSGKPNPATSPTAAT